MIRLERMVAAGVIAGFAAFAQGSDGTGLTVHTDGASSQRWQGRLSLATPTATLRDGLGVLPNSTPPSGSLSLMTDYYLAGSLAGPKRAGGFRATSGVMIGPRSLAWAGPTLVSQGRTFGADRHVVGQSTPLLPGDGATDMPTLPYLGVGYTGLSPRGGWNFSADLGLMSLSPGGAVKLGRALGTMQGLDDTLRDMRWSPVLQLGVSYSF